MSKEVKSKCMTDEPGTVLTDAVAAVDMPVLCMIGKQYPPQFK